MTDNGATKKPKKPYIYTDKEKARSKARYRKNQIYADGIIPKSTLEYLQAKDAQAKAAKPAPFIPSIDQVNSEQTKKILAAHGIDADMVPVADKEQIDNADIISNATKTTDRTLLQQKHPDKHIAYIGEHDRAAVRTAVAFFLLRGYNANQIVDQLTDKFRFPVDMSMIQHAMRDLTILWRQEYLKDIDTVKSTELARIDALEQAYWQAWENSTKKQTAETQETHTENINMGNDQYTNTKSVSKKTETERDGNKMFLDGIQWCIQQRIKLFGLDVKYSKIAIDDWRAEAKRAGINDPDNLLNTVVGKFMEEFEIDQNEQHE